MKDVAWIAVGLAFVFASTANAQNEPTTTSDAVGDQLWLPPGATGSFRPETLSTSNPQAVPPLNVFLSDAAVAPSTVSTKELKAAKIIARVGDEVILAGDLLGQVNQFLHNKMQELLPEQRAELSSDLLDKQRWTLIRQILPQVIDGKLVYSDFLRSIPKDRLPEIQDSLYKAFDDQQLPVVIERAHVQSAADLDRLLRSFGSSLDQQRRTFAEQLAAVQWKERNAASRKEISHHDMLQYYREHIDDFRIVAKACWEQLSIYDGESLSRDASRRKIVKMGNEVFRGASFAAVARRSSDGPTAQEGGVYDWTTKGSLRSETLDQAIFSLPLGRLSQILEDDGGCHIIRVMERQDETFISFTEAQELIKEKIQVQRSEAALKEYVEKLREEFPVWTIFDVDGKSFPG